MNKEIKKLQLGIITLKAQIWLLAGALVGNYIFDYIFRYKVIEWIGHIVELIMKLHGLN